MSEYTAVPSTGKLKLKGIKDGRIEKKKKKKKQPVDASQTEDNSVVLHKPEEEDAQIQRGAATRTDDTVDSEAKDEDIREHLKTEAEKRYDEQRRKRLEKRLEKEGVKTHKERVEELNKYLSNLSEHHDMPKIGPG